jgi:hypothetical protein
MDHSIRALSPLELQDLSRPLPSGNDGALPQARERTQEEIIGEAWARHTLDPRHPAIQSYRIRCAYRLAREIARHLGLIAHDEAIAAVDLQRWTQPRPPLHLPRGPMCPTIRTLLQGIKEVPERYGVTKSEAGPPIYPPTDNRNLLHLWSKLASDIAAFLGIEHGSPNEPMYGRIGLLGLVTTDPVWPSPIALIQYETLLVEEIMDALINNGSHFVHKSLYAVHGFAMHEAKGLIKLAQAECLARCDTDVETDKAMVTYRLEDLANRAKLACDQRVELGVLKQLSIVRGVTRTEPDDAAKDFVTTVRKVANSAKPPLDPPVLD